MTKTKTMWIKTLRPLGLNLYERSFKNDITKQLSNNKSQHIYKWTCQSLSPTGLVQGVFVLVQTVFALNHSVKGVIIWVHRSFLLVHKFFILVILIINKELSSKTFNVVLSWLTIINCEFFSGALSNGQNKIDPGTKFHANS